MKRIFAIIPILLLIITNYSFSQNPYFGIKAGGNFTNMYRKNNEEKQSKILNYAPGFIVGPTMDYRVTPFLAVNASLLLTTKGYQKRFSEDFYDVEITSTERLLLFYVDLPIYVKYELELGMIDAYVGGGPYVGYGYWGKYTWQRSGGGEKEWGKEDVYWGTNPDNSDLKNLDYGLGAIIGGRFDNVLLEIGYQYGFANIAANTDKKQVIRNHQAFVSVSFFFSRFYKYREGNY